MDRMGRVPDAARRHRRDMMFEHLKEKPADKIIALGQAYRDDPRETKIDLGVGVYKTPEGVTPIMRAIKQAEKQLWEAETTKAYTALAGDPAVHRRDGRAGSGRRCGARSGLDHRHAGRHRGGAAGVRTGQDGQSGRARLRVGPDMAQSPEHPGAYGDGDGPLSLFRQHHLRGGFQRHAVRSRRRCARAMWCCCMAAVTTRPGPT